MVRCVAFLAVLLATAGSVPVQAQMTTGSTPGATAAARVLEALFADEWERGLRDYPERATEFGDPRYNDRWTDLSAAAIAARETSDRSALERLHAIDRAALTPEQQLNYDTFEWLLQRVVERQRFREYLRPIDHKKGAQLDDGVAEIMSFGASADYRNYLGRMAALPVVIDQQMALMSEGMKTGNTPPRVLIDRVPAQIARQIVDDPVASPFYRPFKKFADAVSAADRAELQAQAQATIRDRLVPAFRKLQQFVNEAYLPATRKSIAATDLPDGKAYYDFLIRFQTTTNLGVDQIHETGLKEVARLRSAMEKVKDELGFKGSLADFFTYLRNDPKFFCKTPEELLNTYRATAKRIGSASSSTFRASPMACARFQQRPRPTPPRPTTSPERPTVSGRATTTSTCTSRRRGRSGR
jgi:uncharacterized protein (DUF885 family)